MPSKKKTFFIARSTLVTDMYVRAVYLNIAKATLIAKFLPGYLSLVLHLTISYVKCPLKNPKKSIFCPL